MSRAKKEPTIDAQAAPQTATQQVMAKINLSGTAMLPIRIAHKIQALLAEHAIGYDYAYRTGNRPNVEYMTTYNAPTVEVIKKNLKLYDATMLTPNQVYKWAAAIREGEGDAVMEPADFAALTGEE
jgi:hypothetical protein